MTIMTIMQSSPVCNNLNNNNLFLSTNQQLSISLHSLVAFVALFGKLSFSTSFMCETSCAMFGQFCKYANRFTRKHNSKAISGILWSFEPNIVLLFPNTRHDTSSWFHFWSVPFRTCFAMYISKRKEFSEKFPDFDKPLSEVSFDLLKTFSLMELLDENIISS